MHRGGRPPAPPQDGGDEEHEADEEPAAAVRGRLGDDDLPPLFAAAEGIAADGQRRTLSMVRAELSLAVVAAVSGMVSWHVGWGLDVWAGVGTVAFVVATTLSVVRANRNPEARWSRGRAAAESVKTLAWLYAVGGNPFPLGERDADRRLRGRFDELVDSFAELRHLAPLTSGGDGAAAPITPAMAALRARPLTHRRGAYQEDRIGGQIAWYRQRIRQHRRGARRWVVVVVAANACGAVAGLLRLLSVVQVDLLGLAAAVAGSATAWTQLLQQKNMANAYDLAVDDLELVHGYAARVGDEEAWARFVDDAEEAISREQTLWLARRGVPAGIDSIRYMGEVEATTRSPRPRPRPLPSRRPRRPRRPRHPDDGAGDGDDGPG